MQDTNQLRSAESIKSRLSQAWIRAWDEGDVDALDEIVAADYTRRRVNSGAVSGIEDVKSEILDIREALPDLTTEVDHIVVEGDVASVYWHSSGVFSQPLNGVPPTGKRVQTYGSNLARLRDGVIVSEDVTWDASQLLAHLGLNSLASAFEEHDVDAVQDNLNGIPPREMLKSFNRQFISGVTVATTTDENGDPRGLAVSSYNSVSLDPPLVLLCVQKTSSTYPALFKAEYMGINILSCEQRDVLSVFASKAQDKFAQVDWHESEHGVPLIDSSAASIEVQIKERMQALTHTIFIGRVTSAESTDDAPIIYKAGQFFDSRHLDPLD